MHTTVIEWSDWLFGHMLETFLSAKHFFHLYGRSDQHRSSGSWWLPASLKKIKTHMRKKFEYWKNFERVFWKEFREKKNLNNIYTCCMQRRFNDWFHGHVDHDHFSYGYEKFPENQSIKSTRTGQIFLTRLISQAPPGLRIEYETFTLIGLLNRL